MSGAESKLNQRLKVQIKAKIIHAKVLLVLLALFGLTEAAGLFYLSTDSFLPASYFYYPITSCLLLALPAILVFIFPRLGFLIGAILALLLTLRAGLLGDFFSIILYLYLIVAQILAYQAWLQKKRLFPDKHISEDILDSDLL